MTSPNASPAHPAQPLGRLIDFRLPFANIGGIPLPLVPAAADPETAATIASLHARGRAGTHLAAYATYTLDVVPARHHRVICEAIDDLLADRYDDLIVNTPPGSAKSTYTSHALSAFFMGRYPGKNVILATHTAELSEKWSRKVRNTIADPRHQQVFPQSSLSRDSTAVSRWATSLGGEFVAAGVGASILGFRADLCLTENAQVLTKTGYTSISNVKPGDEVLGYDESQLSTGYYRVVAVAERTTDLIYRIHTADGRVVEATGNHPFYAGGRFVPADSLAVGDTLLSSLPCHENDPCFGTGQVDGPLAVGTGVLLEGVFQQLLPAANGEALRGMQRTVPPAQEDDELLFPRLFGVVETVTGQVVQALRHAIQAAQQQVGVLLGVVQERLALAADGIGQQPELAGWEEPEQVSGRQRAGVPRSTTGGAVHGQRGVRDLLLDGEPAWTSCGRGLDQQRPDQHRDALPKLPHEAARCGTGKTTETTVARIEVVCGNTRVFDIQVDTVANFFANGVLVHNCVIDDPVAGFEQAQSITQLSKIHGWFETDLITRLKPRGKIIQICQRLSANDLAGYMMERHAANPTRRLKVIQLRMEALAGEDDGTGRQPGERLWPEWFTQEMVEDARRDDFKWRTLYQQEPPSSSGDWVGREQIRIEDNVPEHESLNCYLLTDLALSINKGDYSVHIVAGIDDNGLVYILDAWRERSAIEKTADRHLDLVQTYHPLESLIDDDNAAKVYLQLLASRGRERSIAAPMKMMPMRGQDKETRAAPLRGMFRSSKVVLKRAPWNEWLVRELLMFPNATGSGVDDGVDALSLLGRRLASLARAAPAPAAAPPAKTWQDTTLDELWEDHAMSRNSRHAKRI